MTSRITVDPAKGTWTYPGLTKTTDDNQKIAVVPPDRAEDDRDPSGRSSRMTPSRGCPTC